MSNNFWIKLHHEILDDPKMGLMPDHLWRRTVEIFLLAGREGVDGQLPDVRAMSWALHVPIEQLEAEIAELEALGIVSRVDSGLIVTNFVKRQAKVDTKERMKAYRGRQRKAAIDAGPSVTDDSEDGYANVTSRNTDIDLDIDSDIKDDDEDRARDLFFSKVVNLYENNIHPISPIIADEIKADYVNVPLHWWEQAIKKAGAANVRKWSYVRSILDRSITANLAPDDNPLPTDGNGKPAKGAIQTGRDITHAANATAERMAEPEPIAQLDPKQAEINRFVEQAKLSNLAGLGLNENSFVYDPQRSNGRDVWVCNNATAVAFLNHPTRQRAVDLVCRAAGIERPRVVGE